MVEVVAAVVMTATEVWQWAVSFQIDGGRGDASIGGD